MAEQPVDAATRLAVQRTRLAEERTLMAWIRTSTSLIAFGFTIFKFFEYLATNERRREPIVSPWVIGMIMILMGLTGLNAGVDSAPPGDEGTTGRSWTHAVLDSGHHGRLHRRSGRHRAVRRGLQDVALTHRTPCRCGSRNIRTTRDGAAERTGSAMWMLGRMVVMTTNFWRTQEPRASPRGIDSDNRGCMSSTALLSMSQTA